MALYPVSWPVQAEERLNFDIPESSADDGLMLYAEQAGRQVLFPYDLMSRYTTNSVNGRYGADEALALLLAGSGLEAAANDTGTLTIGLQETFGEEEHVAMQKKTVLGGVITFLASVFSVSPGAAQEPEASKPGVMEEIFVTAQRRTELIQDVPIAMTVQSQEDLARAGILDIRDLGQVVPGLTFAGQAMIAVPAIRGVQSRIGQAGNEQPVAIYVDGVYQSNQIVNMFDLADISRVEVLKGPQGTLFGRNTTGGAIRIETISPQYEFQGKVGGEYGYYTGSDEDSGDYSVNGYITGPIVEDVLAFSLSGYYRNVDGFLTNDVTGGGSGDVEKYIIRGKLLWEPTENIDILFTASTVDREDLQAMATQSLNGNGTSGFYPDGITSTEPWHVATELRKGSNPLDVGQDSFTLKADFTFDNLGTLTSLTYQDNEASFTVDLDTGTSALCKASFACLDFYQDYPSENFQQELIFTSEKFNDRWSFVAGAYYHRSRWQGYSGSVNNRFPTAVKDLHRSLGCIW
jgi:iron complex outermembrane receptor protein